MVKVPKIHDLQFFTVRCYQIVCHGYHETLDAFFHAFRDVCLDDLLELHYSLCQSSNSMRESPFRSLHREVTPTTSSLCHHLNIEVFALHFTLINFIYTFLLLM